MSDPVPAESHQEDKFNGVLAWVKSREKAILLAAVILQIGFLLSMIFIRVTPLLTGDSILVRVQPVDPRDLFRGDYVILSYEFSRAPLNGISGLQQRGQQPVGQTVYVTLLQEPDGKHWRADKFSVLKPASGRYLRGTLSQSGAIEYGIESFFVQEGTGRQYEEAIGMRKLSAELAVTSDGQAALRRLVIE